MEVLDCSTDSSLKLQYSLSRIGDLVVDDDFEIHTLTVHHALDGAEIQPDIVGVEDFEL